MRKNKSDDDVPPDGSTRQRENWHGEKCSNETHEVAQNDGQTGGSAIDGRTTRWAGYAISQRKRKCIEQVFGWGKTVGRIRQAMYRGRERVKQLSLLTQAAYNLTRMRTLAAKAA